MMKYHFSILVFLIFISMSCRNQLVVEPEINYGDPYQIVNLTEIINNSPIDRTSEILNCRLDDLFFFHGAAKILLIKPGESSCEGDKEYGIEGFWGRTETDNLDGELMTVQLADIYGIHDSLLFGQSEIRFTQGYEIVKIEENELTVQNHTNFSTPKTQNIWQLKFSR